MMTFEWICRVFVSPIFFFMGLFLFVLVCAGIYGALAISPGYVVLSCFLFILSFNAFRVGWKFFKARDF